MIQTEVMTGPLDLSSRKYKMTQDSAVIQQYGFDSCGALDLSSSGSSSTKPSDEETESNSDNGDLAQTFTKRKADVLVEFLAKRKKIRVEETASEGLRPAAQNKRKNIRDVLTDRMLQNSTREAKALEDERLQRLQGSDSEESKLLSDSVQEDEEEDEEEDPNNSGMHVNDCLNVHDADGRVLVNTNHPESDPDIHLAPQLEKFIKPHQIGGVRFLYDNVVESLGRFNESQGFGCILAHNMGLGKTMQVISFIDVLLSNTTARSVLCIVPINTLQNWLAEFNHWLPAKGEQSSLSRDGADLKYRNFKIYVLNDNYKNIQQRSAVIKDWGRSGGVLMMGYELYRQLSNKKSRKRKGKNHQTGCDFEQKSESSALHDIQKYLVNPGPDLVICDEGHRIKNSHASISQAATS